MTGILLRALAVAVIPMAIFVIAMATFQVDDWAHRPGRFNAFVRGFAQGLNMMAGLASVVLAAIAVAIGVWMVGCWVVTGQF